MIRVYQSTDVGAPQNLNAAGSIISILAACLVTGYGTQAAAGWSVPFQDVNTSVFKPGVGSNGMHIKVTDTAITPARVKCFESMTDINTGLGQFPSEIQQPGGFYFQKGDHATIPRLWTVIATEKFFVAFFETAVGTQKMQCFGDFDSYKTGDLFNTVAIFPSTF